MKKDVRYIWHGLMLVLFVLAGLVLVRQLMLGTVAREEVVEVGSGKAYKGPAFERTIQRGAVLFRDNCVTCHNMGKGEDAYLSLKDAVYKVKDRKLLIGWIRNADSVLQLKTGNRYYKDLYEMWNRTPMGTFPHLTDEDIECILTYVDSYDSN